MELELEDAIILAKAAELVKRAGRVPAALEAAMKDLEQPAANATEHEGGRRDGEGDSEVDRPPSRTRSQASAASPDQARIQARNQARGQAFSSKSSNQTASSSWRKGRQWRGHSPARDFPS